MTDFLQYGAMGLLAIVLTSLGLTAREVLRRESTRAERRDAATEERRERQDAFFHELRIEDREERRVFAETLTRLVEQGTEADLRVVKQLEGVCEFAKHHEERASERTQGLLDMIQRTHPEVVQDSERQTR